MAISKSGLSIFPGTYSLAAQSPGEVVARDYILSGEPDVVVNVVDATEVEATSTSRCRC